MEERVNKHPRFNSVSELFGQVGEGLGVSHVLLIESLEVGSGR